MIRVAAIVQARLGSTRLPGKVLMDLAGEPMLARVVQRAGRARRVDITVVATSDLTADDAIAALGAARGFRVFRGSEGDVLDRYYRAARALETEIVVRITADCPFIEPAVVDQVVDAFLEHRPDYASNVLPIRRFPRGLDVEVLSFGALERSWREDRDPVLREHVTSYIEAHPELFRVLNLTPPRDYSHLRWTVDTPEDLAFARKVYEHFGHDRFSWTDVLALLERNPEWSEINRHVRQTEIPLTPS